MAKGLNQGPAQGLSRGQWPEMKPGQRVFVQGQGASPLQLLEQFVQVNSELADLEFVHLHLEGQPAHFRMEYRQRFRVNNLFVGPQLRHSVDFDRVDYTPLFLSEVPRLFKSGRFPIDVALIQVSPPDRFGYCSLGIGADIARAAVDHARVVLAQVNRQMPRTHGDTLVHLKQISASLEVDSPLPQIVPKSEALPNELVQIGNHVAGLVEDGSTLQVGIGAIPDAVLHSLKSHRHLGVHSEMWSDGMMELIQNGAVDNSRKSVHPGKSLATFILGTRKLYDFVDDNPSVELYPSDYVNSPTVIARNPKVVAINSAVEVDLTGQVCADSVGHRLISGVGGQIDFIRGAALCEGGKPIIALTSRTRNKQPRIVPELRPGSGVVTTRADVHYIITEYGVADLYGKSLGQRAKALIQIAHPEDRESLAAAWMKFRNE